VTGNLRVITLNLWGTQPPLEARLALAARHLQALAPDVVCLQEVRPIDPTGEYPRPAGKAVGVPTPRDFASLIAVRAGMRDG